MDFRADQVWFQSSTERIRTVCKSSAETLDADFQIYFCMLQIAFCICVMCIYVYIICVCYVYLYVMSIWFLCMCGVCAYSVYVCLCGVHV